ncbi:monosaccharide ABC transporter substrate-binding protein (CUT2 family) [Halanaerobium saccharolyticum]|uniref:Monosaccharide ABC transporter substrate-binding protein (CUT2 family) n=1 Tax=Halanaerobium saccharolyticum TaxID=43595 RepID=A0A4R7YQJ7_9FIRM|nr:sugar ABC transporter substrate-binding protein [Halanaerobium saccharolyticum]RAK05198.1 monosaccharide ABC transporter substrate-binding protein (CUT2 family) [Halanaerobium saccharolyticum]TDV99029.1 monosaccharide ABC transporter substrate-binding protein (CUT2 family) [Halanaerobium saccharolyticum]TDX51720.1 monosaccharide ABC transporter substrate-binding protein (CUT2 family) [Halanaerobium saccharolyticum]
MRKLFYLFIVLMLVLGVTVTVSAQTEADEEYRISVVLKATNSDYWKSVQAGADQAAEDFGVEVSVVGPSNETQVMQQINLLEDQISRQVDGLVVAPLRPSAAKTVLEKAISRGIPVVTIDTDAEFEGKTSFAGTGNFQAAQQAGNYMVEKLDGEGEIAIVRGAAGDYIHDQRVEGFLDAIGDSNINVVSTQPADSQRGEAVSVMQNILQTYPNIDGVYGTNDEMALGAFRALKSTNAGDNVTVIGFDGSPDAIKSIRNGELTATVQQDSYNIGYTGVELMVKTLNGEEVEKTVPVPTNIIDKDNVDESIRDLRKAFSRDRLENIFGEDLIEELLD